MKPSLPGVSSVLDTALIFTVLSRFEDLPGRADARRNARRVLDAAAALLAADPLISLERVAAHAGVSRTTLYHHFPSREALLDGLTNRSVNEVYAALESARPTQGAADEAVNRALKSIWQVVGRYRGLVSINPRQLGRDELRRRLEPALEPVRSLTTPPAACRQLRVFHGHRRNTRNDNDAGPSRLPRVAGDLRLSQMPRSAAPRGKQVPDDRRQPRLTPCNGGKPVAACGVASRREPWLAVRPLSLHTTLSDGVGQSSNVGASPIARQARCLACSNRPAPPPVGGTWERGNQHECKALA